GSARETSAIALKADRLTRACSSSVRSGVVLGLSVMTASLPFALGSVLSRSGPVVLEVVVLGRDRHVAADRLPHHPDPLPVVDRLVGRAALQRAERLGRGDDG